MGEEENPLKTLSKESEIIREIQRSIQLIKKLTEVENPHINVYKIILNISRIEKMLTESKLDQSVRQNITTYLQGIKTKIPEWEDHAKRSFGERLDQAFREAGFQLKGQYPTLTTSFYTLKVYLDNENIEIWYGPEQELLGKYKPIPEIVTKKLIDFHKQITQRKFDEKAFLSNLYEAYRIVAYRNNKNIGDAMPITEVLSILAFSIQTQKFKINPIKSNYSEYSRVFFSYDLYRLKERKIDNVKLALVTATRASTRRRADFLWIPWNEEGAGSYISHISFKEA